MGSAGSTFISNYHRNSVSGPNNDPEIGIARRSYKARALPLKTILPISLLILAMFVPVLSYPIGKHPRPVDECCQYFSFLNLDIKGLVKEIPMVTIGPNYYLNCVATILLLMKIMEVLLKIGRMVVYCFPCCRKDRTSKEIAGTLERAADRPVPGWHGAWVDFGKLVGSVSPPINWEFTPEQMFDSGEMARCLTEGCFSYKDPNMRFSALCWGLANAYRAAVDHFQKVKVNTETQTTPPETSDVPIKSTEVGVQTQLEVNAISTKSTRTGTQAKNRKVIIAGIKKKKTWVREVKELTDPSPQPERTEEREEEEEEDTQDVMDEGAAAMGEGATESDEGAAASDEGATVREEEVVVTEEGAIGREEAATREKETATREGARPKELGARPKEYRIVPREKKVTVQTTSGILSLDDLYPDYTFSVTKDAKKEPKHSPQLEGELSLPLQTQPSLGGVNDWRRRPLSQQAKDYSLPPPAGYRERRRSPSPRRERHRSPSPRYERRRSPSPRRERRRSPSPRYERRRSPSPRRERRRSPSPRYERRRNPSPRREQYRSLSPRHAQSPPPHERCREEVGAVPRRSGRVKREVEKILRGRDGQEIMRESEITQSLTTRELRDLRRDYMRLPGEEVLTWLVRCWDKGADSHVIEGDEARQLGSIARDPVIEQEMGREKMASSLWLRILHAVRAKYPFKESLKSSSRKWRTAEEGIQYLRELAMLEIIYSDPDYYDIQVPENVPCTQPMWKKVIQGAPKPYISCLIPVYNPKMEEPSVDTMCAWIRTIEENMEDSFNPLYQRTYDRERMERDYEYSRYEDDLRDREDRRYRDYQERPMGRSQRDRPRRPRPRPRSWSRSRSRSLSFTRRRKENSKRWSRNQLWAYLRSKGENMKKWDGEPTSKLEARVRELKRKKTDKKVVYVVDGDFLEEKLRSPKHEKMEVHFDSGKKSKKSKSNSDDECSDQDQ